MPRTYYYKYFISFFINICKAIRLEPQEVMKNQLRDKGLFMQLCYACLVPTLKGDLESTFAVLGVNVNYKIFKAGRTTILQKEFRDPLNKAEPWHDEPHCQAKGEPRRILQRNNRTKTENEGQSIWQQPRYNQAAQKTHGKQSMWGWRRILFDEGLLIHFFHL